MKEEVPARSRFGNAATRFVYQLATGVPVTDTQTGLRAFHGNLLPRMLSIPGERYEYEMNVLLICAKEGIAMEEISIATVYLNHNDSSHFNTLRQRLLPGVPGDSEIHGLIHPGLFA